MIFQKRYYTNIIFKYSVALHYIVSFVSVCEEWIQSRERVGLTQTQSRRKRSKLRQKVRSQDHRRSQGTHHRRKQMTLVQQSEYQTIIQSEMQWQSEQFCIAMVFSNENSLCFKFHVEFPVIFGGAVICFN